MNGKNDIIDMDDLKNSTKMLILNTIKFNKNKINYKRIKNPHFNKILSLYESDKFSDNYELLKKIGEGCFSIVRICRNKHSNKLFAVKINKSIDEEHFNISKNEFDNMCLFSNNKGVCKAYELYVEDSCIYTVLEYCKGITLQKLFEKSSKYYKNHSSYLRSIILTTKQICQTVKDLHNCNIIHRDIKYDNIIVDLSNKRSKSQDFLNQQENEYNLEEYFNHHFQNENSIIVKIVDFNISRKVKDYNSELFSLVGTPHFSAPELLEEKLYDNRVDVWSIGINFYFMIFNKLPFKGDK